MLNQDFKEFAELLNARGVEYLVVGGYALAVHGHPRYTGDIDFWLCPEAGNIAKLLEALKAFGFAALELGVADFGPDAVIQLGQPPRRIDLLTSVDGVSFRACYDRREVVDVSGVLLNFIGLEDFKANKRASGRHKDLADLDCLED
ncbi:MAG: nucleotidyltransferase [Pelomonas sp.]|nr:nucleotidyltransferase [Roseateles sp.]